MTAEIAVGTGPTFNGFDVIWGSVSNPRLHDALLYVTRPQPGASETRCGSKRAQSELEPTKDLDQILLQEEKLPTPRVVTDYRRILHRRVQSARKQYQSSRGTRRYVVKTQ